ncbi:MULTISPECIES: MMPL family transporter [Caballeronia]|uniref:Membrane protein n=1 Tax=Caballeronia zhejiangensis TaxID=871203 RepID=A0A656QQD4_9BURK|nr:MULTISPECIES: MMPL family transporter [Caballeronia]EKS70036.1 exporter-like protein [Burkholderia sp. SJ98]KDR32226.1 membrane protein [Caballeronia zhejiangensis]MDR5790729.1 MMPL family transporter [Caballeronia sp. LP003]
MRAVSRSLRQPAVIVWLCFLAACAAIIARASFSADLSAFLPRTPSEQQRVLVEQLRDGLVSRLILVGIEGGDANARAGLSRKIAATLREDKRFSAINNGEPVGQARDERFVFEHRYRLSPSVTPERFSESGLKDALADSLDLLASSAGMMTKDLLPHDPTGEVTALVSRLDSGAQPAMHGGVWASRDGQRAVLLAQTAGPGSDTDAQASAMAAIRAAFDKAAPGATPFRLLLTGPGVIAVESRDTIMRDVRWLSAASIVLIVVLLLAVYRSVPTLLLGLMPVLSGVAAGVAAVSLAFGTVHGLTLGFGTTLIGEAVDYSIYLFVQSAGVQRRESLKDWVAGFWPTIRLGVLTSICGFASMLFSGFPGLVQLGLYSIVGLSTAGIVTRFVLPHLLPQGFAIRDVSRLGNVLARFAARASHLRVALAVLLFVALATLLMQRHGLWSQELSSLSPVPKASQDLDERLRADVGAPDVRYLVVVSAASEQAALERAEAVARQLQPLVDARVIAGFESPATYLPSDAAQRARIASLPDADTLRARLAPALRDQTIQVKPEVFEPFIADVEAARAQPLLRRADLRGTSMALAVDSLLTERDGRWTAMLPLRAAEGSDVRVHQIRAAVAAARVPDALFVDMKAEADRLYRNYVHEDIRLSLGGFAAIVVLLVLALRSPVRAARTLAPLVAAVIVVIAGLALAGKSLTILHLIGMLLIVAVGSNYALFFNYRAHAENDAVSPQTLVSLVIANLATVLGFGLLALSNVPMLKTFGLTVGPGAILALLFSAILAPRSGLSR